MNSFFLFVCLCQGCNNYGNQSKESALPYTPHCNDERVVSNTPIRSDNSKNVAYSHGLPYFVPGVGKRHEIDLPLRLALIAPWCDLTCSTPSSRTNRKTDPVLYSELGYPIFDLLSI